MYKEYQFEPEATHFLGTFNVTSGKMYVSDPCYSRDTWCQGLLENVKNGVWKAAVVKGTTDWGDRCWEVFAVNDAYPLNTEICEITSTEIGVDSGQAGIFDADSFHGGEDEWGDNGWY